MTYEEAIEELKDRYLGMSVCANREQCEKANKALDIAISALEKQIPKKPIYSESEELVAYDGYNEDGTLQGKIAKRKIMRWLCPICELAVGVKTTSCEKLSKYCPFCGRALDWGDME